MTGGSRMLGDSVRRGPGGRDCPCCGPAPGAERKQERRQQKRRERAETRRLVGRALEDDPKRDVIVDCERPEIDDAMIQRGVSAVFARLNRSLMESSPEFVSSVRGEVRSILEAALGGEQ